MFCSIGVGFWPCPNILPCNHALYHNILWELARKKQEETNLIQTDHPAAEARVARTDNGSENHQRPANTIQAQRLAAILLLLLLLWLQQHCC